MSNKPRVDWPQQVEQLGASQTQCALRQSLHSCMLTRGGKAASSNPLAPGLPRGGASLLCARPLPTGCVLHDTLASLARVRVPDLYAPCHEHAWHKLHSSPLSTSIPSPSLGSLARPYHGVVLRVLNETKRQKILGIAVQNYVIPALPTRSGLRCSLGSVVQDGATASGTKLLQLSTSTKPSRPRHGRSRRLEPWEIMEQTKYFLYGVRQAEYVLYMYQVLSSKERT
jgi:hypothetical protein